MTESTPVPNGEFLLYETEDGKARVECRFEDDTLWLTQALMAELFQVKVPTINEHLKTLYSDGELRPEATIRKFLIVRQEGSRRVTRNLDHYSLEAILAVGYRVRSLRGTQFRRWATERLKEYLVKGFTLDDERLKNPPRPGSGVPDYFDELLERIRDIRASERRMYLRVKDIFALAGDYVPSSAETEVFFRTIQNKLHHAATGRTAAELIVERAAHAQPNMGLTTWKGSRVCKADVTVAKNYLHEDEISELNRIVVMWLDFAEGQAKRRKQVFLKDWEIKLDEFLKFNEYDVLRNAGKISKEEADSHAHYEYEQFAARRRAQLEAQGEEDSLKMLQEAAKRLPATTPDKRK
ncbi:virulence RhuM family protein [Desulfocurvibacter africanus]|uniref:Virulence protein-like protein n=1 Tax=Desulfocurvibacter africanus subsp. africanus str. Walvis Bay TaxID=690850 RepID=F3YXG2_DESAF|nr:virulence RhuM family protein [Desulfocurvibacter africanus]EGJ51739.1 virulence protein-like protein [Desulfocurvibacter africanus subsp. africanus str. Walvis Bay]